MNRNSGASLAVLPLKPAQAATCGSTGDGVQENGNQTSTQRNNQQAIMAPHDGMQAVSPQRTKQEAARRSAAQHSERQNKQRAPAAQLSSPPTAPGHYHDVRICPVHALPRTHARTRARTRARARTRTEYAYAQCMCCRAQRASKPLATQRLYSAVGLAAAAAASWQLLCWPTTSVDDRQQAQQR